MKKTLLTLTLLTLSLNASELLGYKVSIDVKPTKANGKSWDISGGAPDIYVRVDGKKMALKKECRNSYRCENITFVSNKEKFYIEVYDKDIASDDLVGKGECRAGATCTLGSATMHIGKGEATKIVLADARGDTQGLKEEVRGLLVSVASELYDKHKIDDDKLQNLDNKIKQLHIYGDDLSEKERVLLQGIVKMLEETNQNNHAIVDSLKSLSTIAQMTTV